MSATRQRYRFPQIRHAFAVGDSIKLFDYSRVTRVRVLLTFILRAYVLCAFWLR